MDSEHEEEGGTSASTIRRQSVVPEDIDAPASRIPPTSLQLRYEELRFIGEGSMGTLFRGWDSRLGRAVAIKLLKSDAPADTRRFLAEARAQARVRHENVCQVYEVGEVDGEPYIAMEYIPGESFDRAQGMTLEQKVKVVREVAAALHEAHRLGMIHRDIKPGNIMVVHNEDGSYKPYIVDFGLARDISSTGASTQNGIVGTPAYMSPEQAAGNSALLDRRTDVYSLGATLFDVLAGRTPFVGSNALTLLTQVIYDDAPALGRIRKGVPQQLETIVMTCLQRQPERRYESARALGDDLQRFLDGGPVQAKRPPLTFVLSQKAKRHKALVAVSSIGLCIAMVLCGMWIHEARQAAKQTEFARELGEDVKYMELFLRSAYTLPTHEMALEFQIVRERLARIEQRMAEAGSAGLGPGHYALGRAHMALHEYERAHEHLKSALAADYAKPEVHYALGIALGGRYREALDQARRIEDHAAREAATRKAELDFGKSALFHLRASGETEVESRSYIDGLIAFHEGRHREAAEKAAAAILKAPWLYEARKLEGDARLEEGIHASSRGEKKAAHEFFTQSINAYFMGTTIARSDANLHEALCEAWKQDLILARWEGQPYRKAFEQALVACNAALVANPSGVGALHKQSQIYFIVGAHELINGNDPRPMLESAINAARSARRLQPQDAIAADELGNALIGLAQYSRKVGSDPRQTLAQALEEFDQATRIEPTFAWGWNDAGLSLLHRTAYEVDNGIDPRPSCDAAMGRFTRAAQEDPQYIGSFANAVFVLGIRASYEFAIGLDPRPTVQRAVEIAERGYKVDPKWLPLLNNRGWAELVTAKYEERTDIDPSKTLDQVEASFQASLDINKDEADTQFGMGSAKHVRALYQIRKGLDPQKYLEEARTFLERAAELDAQEPAIRLELGQLYLTMARQAIAEKGNSAAVLDNAEKAFREGLRVNARYAPLHSTLAEVLAMRAELGNGTTAEREKLIAGGLSAADAALEHNPTWALAMAAKSTLHALRASLKPDSARAEDIRLATEWLAKALTINALLPPRFKDRLDALRNGSSKPPAL